MLTLSQSILSVQHLSCERGYRPLFEHLQFDVSGGDILRITGANGSGKTSLLNILAGLSSQFEGDIAFCFKLYEGNGFFKIIDSSHLPRKNTVPWFEPVCGK